jgi:hypothetical protein
LHIQEFNEAKLIPALTAAEFYRIHALAYKVQAQPARLHIFERAPAQFFRVHRGTAVFQQNFQGLSALAILRCLNSVEGCFDGLFGVSAVGMPNDICERFVDGKNHRVALRLGESQPGRKLPQGLPHYAEHLWIAPQLHFE